MNCPLQECGQALADDKVVKKGSEIARGSPAAVEQLVELLTRLMRLHQQCCGEAEDMRWKARGWRDAEPGNRINNTKSD